MKLHFGIAAFAAMTLLFLAGCSSSIDVTRVGAAGRPEYSSSIPTSGISQNTGNLLGNFLLEEVYQEHPVALVAELEALFWNEPRAEYLTALADCSLHIGLRKQKDPDEAIQFFLSAALYSYSYLAVLDRPNLKPYNAERLAMMRIYNIAISEIFSYLDSRGIALNSSLTLNAAGGQRVTFLPPRFELSLESKNFSDFLLCADFRTRNLTHMSRRFGIGAPLICSLTDEAIGTDDPQVIRFAEQQTFPGTLMIEFAKEESAIHARLVFLDPKNHETTNVGEHALPLEADFSTPLAYMIRNPLPFNYLMYMIRPGETRQMQGLRMLEPYRSDRIPVVFVHGLMSNIRTWMQMVNTLQSDSELRRHYQFWAFTYSSGNPVLYSAQQLRAALLGEKARLEAAGESTKMFSRMVVVGHSMGGLVTKSMVLDPEQNLVKSIFGEKTDEVLADLTPEQLETVEDIFAFKPLPFVKRVVYLSVPHRGSDYATTWLGRFGSGMVELPVALVTRGNGIIKTLMERGIMMPNDSKFSTGIDNLDPKNQTLNLLEQLPYAEGVKYHSIIGNRKAAGAPGGSDGIVPYLSSHLDGAESELIVKSDHSVQLNPLAIQELRRILFVHLRQFPDLKIEMPEIPGQLNKKNEKLVTQ